MSRKHPEYGRATITVALACVAALLAAAGAGGWWWFEDRRVAERAARAYAAEAAAALTRGELPPRVDVGDRTTAQRDLDTILDGMGSLEHRVAVADVRLRDGVTAGEVVLAHTWRIGAGKEPWTYETVLPVSRTSETWSGSWSRDVAVAGLRANERVRAVRRDATRAEIVGGDGAPLVKLRDVARIGIDRTTVSGEAEARRSAARLAEVVDIDAGAYADRVAGAGPEASSRPSPTA